MLQQFWLHLSTIAMKGGKIKLNYFLFFLSSIQIYLKKLSKNPNKMSSKPSTIRLTPENAHKYLGHDIIFRTHNKDTLKMNHVMKKIRCVRDCMIEIDCPSLNNRLGIKTVEIYVIL